MFKKALYGETLYPPTTQKRNGSALVVLIAVAAIITSMIALATAKISQASLGSLSTSKIALQAQQYASAKADLLKAINYNELTAQERKEIQNSNFSDEVIVGAETAYPGSSDINQRICTINVYSDDEVLPRYSLRVIKTSAELPSSLPAGSIIPWYGNLNNIPDGFALCNGSNGTPDLRNKFIVGAGSTYNLGNTGGADSVKLTGTQIGSHYHRFGYHNGNNTGYFLTSAGSFVQAPRESWMRAGKWNGSGGGGYNGWDGGSGTNFGSGQNLVTSLAVATAAQEAHENRPPYYALYYIMKLAN